MRIVPAVLLLVGCSTSPPIRVPHPHQRPHPLVPSPAPSGEGIVIGSGRQIGWDRDFGYDVWCAFFPRHEKLPGATLSRLNDQGIRQPDLIAARFVLTTGSPHSALREDLKMWDRFVRGRCGNGVWEGGHGFYLVGILLQHRTSCLPSLLGGNRWCARDGRPHLGLEISPAAWAEIWEALSDPRTHVAASLLEALLDAATRSGHQITIDHLTNRVRFR